MTHDVLSQDLILQANYDHKAALNAALTALQQNNLPLAIQFMQQAATLAPEIVLYKRNLGELLRRAGQLEAAIAKHKVVIDMEPHSAENHFLLGLAFNDNRQYELAIQHYHKALSFNQNYGVAWNNLGATLESMGDKHTAKIAYTTAIALNSKHIEALNNLGAIYSEEGRLDEARRYFTAAIAANPEFVDAHYNLSLIKTYTLTDPHLGFLKSIDMERYPIPIRIRYYFALGKALDDTKQYAHAFKAYAEGNRLHYQYKPWNKEKLNSLLTQMQSVFTSDFFPRSQPITEQRCPIFIVGMPRSGTSLIEQILASHENIYGAGELTILDQVIHDAYRAVNMPFGAWLAQLSDQEFIDLGKKYLDIVWKLAPNKKFIIDKMPGNCFYVGMIYRMLPTAKIIHAMRDPMDSCFSCFTHHFKDEMLFSYNLPALGNYYVLYAQAMQFWHDVLPKNTIFDLAYEEMVANYEMCSRRLLDYLGLPWDPNCLHFYENKRIVKTASLTQVRQPIYKTSVQRWRHFVDGLEPLLEIVAPYRREAFIF